MRIIIDTYPYIERETSGHRITLTLLDGSVITLVEPLTTNDSLLISVNGEMTIKPISDNSCIIKGE